MANKPSTKRATATTAAVPLKGRSMSTTEREIAEADALLFLSSKQTRKDLVACFISQGRTSADWEKPEGDACALFYNSLRAVSRTAADSGQSKLGLTEAELVQFPKGYSINTVTDEEVKSSQLPDFCTEPNRIGKFTIRRYHQAQRLGWFKSTLKSMINEEAKVALISGGAAALTKAKSQLTVDNLSAALKRDADAGEDGVIVMSLAFAKQVRSEIELIVAVTDVAMPKWMVVK